MIKCPRCGLYMEQEVEFNCGIPFMAFKCSCGYNSSDNFCNSTNTIKEEEVKILGFDLSGKTV